MRIRMSGRREVEGGRGKVRCKFKLKWAGDIKF